MSTYRYELATHVACFFCFCTAIAIKEKLILLESTFSFLFDDFQIYQFYAQLFFCVQTRESSLFYRFFFIQTKIDHQREDSGSGASLEYEIIQALLTIASYLF